MEVIRKQYLLEQLRSGAITFSERRELLALLRDDDNKQWILDTIEKEQELITGTEDVLPSILTAEETDKILNNILLMHDQPAFSKIRGIRYRYWWVAAAVALLVAVGGYMLSDRYQAPATVKAIKAKDLMPGSDKAILTLQDGTTVPLDSAGKQVIKQSGTTIRQSGGSLQYTVAETTDEIHYNTVQTPAGGQFHLILPDGSSVWLNAASSLRFPTAFNGKERSVEITGEAYFEIKPDPRAPFLVKIGNKAITEVLGTSFNINSYTDESSTNITLLTGVVRVVNLAPGEKEAAVVLKPGQQARLTEKLTVIDGVDTNGVIAWKNGIFNFDNISLRAAMRQLERWYNIHVMYEEDVPDIYFGGTLPRNISLNDLLPLLKESHVNYRIEGRNLIITK